MVKSMLSLLLLRINQVNLTSYRIFKAPNRASDRCSWRASRIFCISQKGRFFPTWLLTSSKNKPSLKNYNNSVLSEVIRYALTLYLGYICASRSVNIFQGNTQLNIWLGSEDVWSIFFSWSRNFSPLETKTERKLAKQNPLDVLYWIFWFV